MKVPFLDLKAQYETISGEIATALQRVLESTAFAGGPFVAQFEKEFAKFYNSESAIGVGSGTAALWAVLKALGIKEGDEVITAPNTFIATAEAISMCGARPVFVDIDEQTYNINPGLIEKVINPRTKAIIPVHLYGQMADMDSILEIARVNKLYVVEDACQAHGAKYKGRVGSFGDASCFSFYPGKNLGAYGEAGAVVTNNTELADKIRMFRDHGQKVKYHHSMVGWNARMDGFQGSVLSVKLKHLRKWNESRRKNAQSYNDLLADVEGVITPIEAEYAKHVYHIYAIRCKRRDELINFLSEKKVFCGIHYPVPLHLQDAYKSLGFGKGSFPVAESCVEEIVSLPMFSELTEEQIEKVVKEIKNFFKD
jgi:dTDP-4-amino-4,6-dideoxygalactose transaminase